MFGCCGSLTIEVNSASSSAEGAVLGALITTSILFHEARNATPKISLPYFSNL
eukprot:TRINITY_DN2962_c0_g1_i1.p1 TRINITY_DN2962_c0_g1~~TRINITY_DN2962_c0_g1_i1.p1  ORF type:complete len:53 (+),score=4.44 TRINITY_DN2962_c0_g1_i1:252-410(+)